ncbi:multivesicular body subunit 12B isoform X1 [Anoplophora glabripennis]|uniref:multivesicular body subunit 12B isoform X1 n=1 Tax=Anoplophora glabripennis TaxID=217634 RepID=UPI000874B835|nr:multivesicular body subunit 12B isoform X1 [Anoplophora glabripennis]XP_018562511.1 multivesicular body subunit 12B isoform X1 [Anoplophora glabripennis]XP_018562513.1 multivesicular body subunit 12B isoform X1 [Anoplophora glabripennis]
MLKSSVQHKILNSLPDDRPITAIQIIENLDKCPAGFYPICKTYDQDSDADLRESSIFKSSGARYLCLSKTEGLPNFVVQEILVLTDKANPPKGFSLLNRTADSEQKAWRKKLFCYRLVNKREIRTAVTDIIICSRLKKAPAGFSFAGELNGVTLCYKMGNVQDGGDANADSNKRDGNSFPSPPVRPPKPSPMSPGNPVYPSLGESDHDYEILRPGYPASGPTRPAPKPPTPAVPHQHSTHTLGIPHALDGVPFIVNPKFLTSKTADKFQFPKIKARAMQQILRDYDYPFTVERQT